MNKHFLKIILTAQILEKECFFYNTHRKIWLNFILFVFERIHLSAVYLILYQNNITDFSELALLYFQFSFFLLFKTQTKFLQKVPKIDVLFTLVDLISRINFKIQFQFIFFNSYFMAN